LDAIKTLEKKIIVCDVFYCKFEFIAHSEYIATSCDKTAEGRCC